MRSPNAAPANNDPKHYKRKEGTMRTGRAGWTLMTRRTLVSGIGALCALVLWAGAPIPARADTRLDFTLRNRVGDTIREIHVKAHEEDVWRTDALGAERLDDGREKAIRFSRDDDSDLWDLKVVMADGNYYIWRGYNLSKISTITIYLSNGR